MTVGDLKNYLNNFDDKAKLYYFDSEAGEDIPFNSSWMNIIDECGELKEQENADKEQK